MDLYRPYAVLNQVGLPNAGLQMEAKSGRECDAPNYQTQTQVLMAQFWQMAEHCLFTITPVKGDPL